MHVLWRWKFGLVREPFFGVRRNIAVDGPCHPDMLSLLLRDRCPTLLRVQVGRMSNTTEQGVWNSARLRGEMGAYNQSDHAPTWFSGLTPPPPPRTPLNYDLDVDVCVIGGGLAGLTVAREVARRGWSVVVLEARRIAWDASGRNCGFVLPGFGADIRRMVERVGIDRAKALWKLSEAGLEYVRATIRETGMPGVEPVAGWLDVSKVD